MADLSSVYVFKQSCNEMVTGLDPADIVKANKMISLVANIVKKYPLVFLPDFVEDFMNGVFTKHMIKKYQLRNYGDFAMIASALKFKGNRSKDPNEDSRMMNLQNKNWAGQYEFLSEQSDIFAEPIKELFNANVLDVLVSNAILDLEFVGNLDLKKTILDLYEKHKNSIPALYNDVLRDSFDKYLSDDLDHKLDNSVSHLASKSYITSMDGDVSLPAKYSKLHDSVYSIISEMRDGLSYTSLMTKIMNEFPLIRITSRIQMIDGMLDELEQKHVVVRSRAYWKYSPDSDQLFTSENYGYKKEQTKKGILSAGRTKFFGRNITPDQFISEINVMETGDLDDLDDQVTRIAGLVLSDAAMLQSPRDSMKEFDFIVNLTDYNFRPEHVEMMKKLDFQATSDIFHCKVMIKEKITPSVLTSLKDAVPPGEQGVIFTCTKVSPEILQQTRDDRKIQIIDEEGIRDWCSITPTIPCRRHSVARVMYGDGVGKIVLVRSLNYESGLAIVETAPDRIETTFPIGCLSEINLQVHSADELEAASNSYFDFACLLSDLAPNTFDEGMHTRIVAIHDRYIDLKKSTNPELYDGPHPPYHVEEDKYKGSVFVEFDNTYARINLSKYRPDDFIGCDCGHSLNEEYHHTLCKHLVATIDHACRDGLEWDVIKHNIETLTEKLVIIQASNVKRMIDAISCVIRPESKQAFKEYLLKHVDDG